MSSRPVEAIAAYIGRNEVFQRDTAGLVGELSGELATVRLKSSQSSGERERKWLLWHEELLVQAIRWLRCQMELLDRLVPFPADATSRDVRAVHVSVTAAGFRVRLLLDAIHEHKRTASG